MTDSKCYMYNLVDRVCGLSIEVIDKITELKQENSKLKQRVVELEKPKKKRKFRAMTHQEFCKMWQKHHLYCKSKVDCYCCPLYSNLKCLKNATNNIGKPCKINGKYIFIEVKE